jgi:hypothetical protein
LYGDRKKTKKVDAFKFKLKKNQAKSFAVSGKKEVGWASVWVHKGSFKVKLDQSPNAKAAPAPKTSQGSVASAGRTVSKASNGTILNGRVSLMAGAKVIKERTYGPTSRVDLKNIAWHCPVTKIDFHHARGKGKNGQEKMREK